MAAEVRRAATALVVAVLAPVLLVACGDDGGGAPATEAAADAPADIEYVIPAGTGERIDAGERVEILPRQLDARVGELIRIENEDDRGQLLGPFFVGAGETLSQRFPSPGTYEGQCSVHPSGELRVVVTA